MKPKLAVISDDLKADPAKAFVWAVEEFLRKQAAFSEYLRENGR